MLAQVPLSQLPASQSQPRGPNHLPSLQRKAEKQSSALLAQQWLSQAAKPFLVVWEQGNLIKLHRPFSSLPLILILTPSSMVSLLKISLLPA